MRANFLQDPTMEAMSQYMGRLSKRQQIVASNLANMDTPGYKTQDISFHATMQELIGEQGLSARPASLELRDGMTISFAPPEPEVREVEGLRERWDGNNVDLDKEMLKLGQTSFGYSLMAQLLRGKFRTIASSINDGRIS